MKHSSYRTITRSALAVLNFCYATVYCCNLYSNDPVITSENLRLQLEKLGDASYAVRESATEALSQSPSDVIPLVVQEFAQAASDGSTKVASAESSMRMLRLLATWANDPEQSPGPEAFLALEQLAQGASSVTALRAQNILTEITLEYSQRVTQRLRANGASIGRNPVQVITTPVYDAYLLRLDENYRGSINELTSLRWLVDVEMVHARGKSINSDVLKQIVKIPNLKILQLRETQLSNADLEMLVGLRELEVLEFIYTKLEPDAIRLLAELPVSRSMRLFGTGLDPVALEQVAEELEGIEFVHGRGGFLGIMSQSQDSNIVGDVVDGSGAAIADLRQDDRIIQINDARITRFDELRKELAKYSVSEVVNVQFERPQQHIDDNGRRYVVWQQMEAKVTLGMQD